MATISEAYNRAVEIHRQGRLEQAEEIYCRILAVEPEHAGSWHLLGVIAQQRGDPATAIQHIRHAISLDGTRAAFYGNLGAALRSAGQLAEAEEVLRKSLHMVPDFAQALTNLGLTLADQDRAEEALEHFHQALRINPGDLALLRSLGYALSETGRTDEAVAIYQKAVEIAPQPMLRFLLATLLPLVYGSQDDMRRWRGRLMDQIDRLLGEGVQIDLSQEQAAPVFSLTHQGYNDRDLQARLVRLYRPPPPLALPPSPRRAGQDRRIRVGFLSSFFNTHTIGKLSRGLIAHLNRDDFRVVVLSLGEHHDPVADFIRARADEFIVLPRQVEPMRAAVAAARLDALIYTDLGMSHTSYTLAFSRLAPVQCVTWGHPSTTGLPTLDYFLSSDAMEPPDAAAHYTERLVRLPSLTFYFYRPPPPERTRDRAAFGLNPQAHSYVCPQSIYKFHPDFDPILADILRRDPQGEVVLIRWAYQWADDLLRARFGRVMPDVAHRVRFIDRMPQSAFVELLGHCDVLLDPLHFGGGMTSLEGISLGVPIVSLPGGFLRGRITKGMFQQMGVTDCLVSTPQQYAATAVRLGTDPAYRDSISRKILGAAGRLFEDRSAVTALEDFLRQAVREIAARR